MDEVLNQILKKLEKLDKIELDVSAMKNDIKVIDKKIDSITDVVANIMEDITELKDKVDKQDVEIRVIKGGAANC